MPVRETYNKGLFLSLLLKDIRQRYNLTYDEMPIVVKREHLLDSVMQHYGALHYYGNDGIIDILEEDLNVSFDRP